MSKTKQKSKYDVAQEYQLLRNLWAGVLKLAIEELGRKDKNGKPLTKSIEARRWIMREGNNIGSFIWICGVLDMCHIKLRTKIIALN